MSEPQEKSLLEENAKFLKEFADDGLDRWRSIDDLVYRNTGDRRAEDHTRSVTAGLSA